MKKNILNFLLLLVLPHSGCQVDTGISYYKIAGETQGTSYHITYAVRDSVNLQPRVDSILKDFDMSLSSWEAKSVLSRLNNNETDRVDDKFIRVYNVARKVWEESDGAFDLTVMPLVNAWGFGPGMKTEMDADIVDSILQFVGMDKIHLSGDKLVKDKPGISIDVNAIAQGYSVDIVAEWFESMGIKNYMVEIGGELRTKGRNNRRQEWKIGVDRPEFGNIYPGRNLQVILSISGRSMATSGNYRKFYEKDGVKYSHSIDPISGYPVQKEVLSATVIMDDCIDADAYATACMIIGLEKSKELAEKVDGMEVYLIYGDESGQYQVYYSEGFEKYIYEELR